MRVALLGWRWEIAGTVGLVALACVAACSSDRGSADARDTNAAGAGGGPTGGGAGASGAGGANRGSVMGSCSNPPASPPSCAGLANTCGPNQDEDCCATLCVPGGTFPMGRGTVASDAYASGHTNEVPEHTASVSAFGLDRFEVTVGRFRKFVAAGSPEPAAGAGKRGHLKGGTEPGWDAAWSVQSTESLSCDSTYQTWTSSAGANDDKPMNCLDWYTAYAFCIWDGGFLPTEGEWEYAAAGGSENRLYPWGAGIDATYAVYHCTGDGSAAGSCAFADILRVGSRPKGDGRWGHADLGGSMLEWILDWYDSGWYGGGGGTCNDCANFTSASYRVVRGGDFITSETYLRAAFRDGTTPSDFNFSSYGARCARAE